VFPFILGLLAASVVMQADARLTLREAEARLKAGDHAAARSTYERAVSETEPGTADRGTAVMGIAATELDLGQYPQAIRAAREAAAVFEALGDAGGRATALNYAGLAAMYAGEYRDAQQAFTEAVQLSRASGSRNALVEQLVNLANVHFFTSHYVNAAHTYDQALAVVDQSPGEPWAGRRRRLILANQAALEQRLGRYDRALALYQALDATSAQLPPDEHAQLLVNLGVLYRRLGDPVKALNSYDRARALFATHEHPDGEIGAIKNRGIVLAIDLGRLAEAEESFSSALERAEAAGNQREMLHVRLYRGETRLREGRLDDASADFEAALALARRLETPEEEWKALYGLGRVSRDPAAADRLFERSMTTIERIHEGIRLTTLRSDFLNDKAEVYDTLIRARLGGAPAADLFALIEGRQSRGWRDMLGLMAPVTLEAVQRALPADTLLLEYWHAPQGAALVAVTRSVARVLPVTVDPQQVSALADALAAGPRSNWQDRARALAATVLPPATWFDGVSHVVVVPGGALALVPFDLLPIGDRLLVEQAAVTYMPSAATLLRTGGDASRWRAPWSLQLEAFADPVFESAALDDASLVRGRLEGTDDEVRLVAAELNGGARLHLGADNRKAALLASDRRPPLLHIASHATTDVNAVEQSRIMFSPAAGSRDADYLFLREVYGLNLAGVELAVLSACDTARGRLARVEGIESFSRAFLAAGARSTVTTLWRVADQPTADFMAVFYDQLQSGVSRDEALRRAKLRFLRSGSALADPHYWAAFVLAGDGLRPVPRAAGWGAAALAVAGPGALLGIAALRLVRSARKRRGVNVDTAPRRSVAPE
jgi:tetratricopeptide (TPR) repeat protein